MYLHKNVKLNLKICNNIINYKYLMIITNQYKKAYKYIKILKCCYIKSHKK